MKNTVTGKPLPERTKRMTYQLVNPVYTYLKMKRIYIESPASLHGLPPLNNTRKIDLTIDKINPFRQVFMWLMHGRRVRVIC